MIDLVTSHIGETDSLLEVLDRDDYACTTDDMSSNQLDGDGRNVLFHAMRSTELDCIKCLIDSGSKIIVDNQRTNILMEAASRNRLDVVTYLVDCIHRSPGGEFGGMTLLDLDSCGRNALFYALSSPTTDVLDLLIESGVPLRTCQEGRTLLMSAVLLNCRMVWPTLS